MKWTQYLLLPVAVIAFTAATAQTKSTKPAKDSVPGGVNPISDLSNSVYKGVKTQKDKGIDVTSPEDTKKTIEYLTSNPEIKAKRNKLYNSNYSKSISYPNVANEGEKHAWLKGIPVPQYPEPALLADPRANDQYAEKLKKHEESVKAQAKKLFNSTEMMQTYEQGGVEALKKKAEKDANKSEVVQRMGGAEKLQTMSEKERDEAARKMVSDMTGGYTVEQIKNMTPAQQQELAKKMAAAKMQNMQAGDYRNVDQKQVNEAKDAVLISEFQQKFYDQLRKEMEPINNMMMRNEEQYQSDLEKLSKWASAAISALPIVRDSEYGPRRDGIEYVEFTLAYMHYILGKNKIANEVDIWERLIRVYVNAFQRLDEFAAANSARPNMSDNMKIALASQMLEGYGFIEDLNKRAGHITNEAASIQLQYNCKVLLNCNDPRQEKYSQK